MKNTTKVYARRTIEQWFELAAVNVKTTTEKHWEIAHDAYERERRGEWANIWHSSAAVHATPCQCVPCRRKQLNSRQ